MALPYHKIPTVFKRDPETTYKTLIEGEFTTQELAYLADNLWLFSEKIDGTNVRVTYDKELDEIVLFGRSAKSILPRHLLDKLASMFDAGQFSSHDLPSMTLYGEGYGRGIQKVGRYYLPDDVNFILFDIKIGDYWLGRDDVEDIASKLAIETVPLLWSGTLADAVEFARKGFRSRLSDRVAAEGLVMRPYIQMFDRAGKRIIAKIKTKDFFPRQETWHD